jgi:hypothetical protein
MSIEAKTLLGLPHKVLAPLCPTGTKPTFRTLVPRFAQLQLNMNAISVRSHHGNGTHWHLVLTLTPALTRNRRSTVRRSAYAPHKQDPVHVVGATAAQITEGNRIHAAARAEFNLYHDTDNALRALLIAAVPYKYIEAIVHHTLSIAQTTTVQLLTHLWSTYSKIHIADILDNLKHMQASWNLEMSSKPCSRSSSMAATRIPSQRNPRSPTATPTLSRQDCSKSRVTNGAWR